MDNGKYAPLQIHAGMRPQHSTVCWRAMLQTALDCNTQYMHLLCTQAQLTCYKNVSWDGKYFQIQVFQVLKYLTVLCIWNTFWWVHFVFCWSTFRQLVFSANHIVQSTNANLKFISHNLYDTYYIILDAINCQTLFSINFCYSNKTNSTKTFPLHALHSVYDPVYVYDIQRTQPSLRQYIYVIK